MPGLEEKLYGGAIARLKQHARMTPVEIYLAGHAQVLVSSYADQLQNRHRELYDLIAAMLHGGHAREDLSALHKLRDADCLCGHTTAPMLPSRVPSS